MITLKIDLFLFIMFTASVCWLSYGVGRSKEREYFREQVDELNDVKMKVQEWLNRREPY
jgi:hypothetical protein